MPPHHDGRRTLALGWVLSLALHGAAIAGLVGLEWRRAPPPPPGMIQVELVAHLPGAPLPGAAAASPPPAETVAPAQPATIAAIDADTISPPSRSAPPEPPPLDPPGTVVEIAPEVATPTPAHPSPVTEKPTPEVVALAPPPKPVPKPRIALSFTPPPMPPPRPAREATPLTPVARGGGVPDAPAREGETVEVARAVPGQAPEGGAAALATGPRSRSAAAGIALPGLARAVAVGVGNPLPGYPFAARRRGLEGQVVISVRVSPSGAAAQVTVLKSSGHRALDRAALRTIGAWRFVPALRDGHPVESTVEIPVTFRLDD